jgi:alkylhydroperoxidase family enzyme
MTEAPQPHSRLLAATRNAVVDGPGSTDPKLRAQVASGKPPSDLARLVAKIRDHAYKVTDADLDALRSRYTEDQLFELIVAAALGAAEDRLNAAVAALERA